MVLYNWALTQQWGEFGFIDSGSYVTLPLAVNPVQVVVSDMSSDWNSLCMSTLGYEKGKFKATGGRNDGTKTQLWGHWIAICM